MNPRPPASSPVAELPPVPLTVEGYATLHQMMRFRWSAWRALADHERRQITGEAAKLLAQMETNPGGQSALFSLLGHKGDLMLVHFRQSFDELNQVELDLARLRLSDYLEPATSYLVGDRAGPVRIHAQDVHLIGRARRGAALGGVEPGHRGNPRAPAARPWRRACFRPMPPHRYICFYPMDRKRGEAEELVHAADGGTPAPDE